VMVMVTWLFPKYSLTLRFAAASRDPGSATTPAYACGHDCVGTYVRVCLYAFLFSCQVYLKLNLVMRAYA
jgi:hypothetical protein